MFGAIRVVSVDPLDFQKRQVPLALLGRPHLPENGIARTQVESLDLAGADVDIVGAVQIVPVLRAEEPVPFGEHLQHAFTP
jgi:hypothetical protein